MKRRLEDPAPKRTERDKVSNWLIVSRTHLPFSSSLWYSTARLPGCLHLRYGTLRGELESNRSHRPLYGLGVFSSCFHEGF